MAKAQVRHTPSGGSNASDRRFQLFGSMAGNFNEKPDVDSTGAPLATGRFYCTKPFFKTLLERMGWANS